MNFLNDLIHLTALWGQKTPNPQPNLVETVVDLRLGRKEDRALVHFLENYG